MKVKQRIYEKKDGTTQLLDSGLFTYFGFEYDKERFLDSYLNGGYFRDRDLEWMVKKQKMHNGERSNSLLSTLDNIVERNSTSKELKEEKNVISSKNKENGIEDDPNGRCIICLEQPRTNAIVPCGHVALCEECGKSPQFSRRLRKFKCKIGYIYH